MGRQFIVPAGVCLNFYAPAGHNLARMQMNRFRLGVKVEEQVFPNQECPNYWLSKAQGRHGFRQETYESLGQLVDRTRARIAGERPARQDLGRLTEAQENDRAVYQAMLDANHRADVRDYENLLNLDFLCIRNRSIGLGINLEGVLGELLRNNYRYEYIFCAFCRGSGQDSPSHDAKEYEDP